MPENTSSTQNQPHPTPDHRVWLLIAAWILVGVPLLWGVWQTLQASLALFR
jgi:hypothetical protein